MARHFLLLGTLMCVFVSCSDDDPENPCGLEPEVGDCDAAIPKYYFDKEEQECKEFIWGGCGGVVPFDSMEECLDCLSDE
ncbi:BPTI/Kunitz domain-containing protein [Allomuricauda sp. SCSIO 65647]|uniref:BPTI/Kunitz domain-containing protein n=1 Tax=Allomuricauda sp. SCSIO 65647 TaxID=2908843 RepID=UPI001F3B2A6D|nr:BPTI/Kunitz domain-containing protein [Muricauda sp. SCSIO 65647]UJH66333.1 BPTI/Kunitz domain-containing protein [Muricauda sp. SCSIO 65647]